MTYTQAIDFLYTQTPSFQQHGARAYKPGLQRMKALAQALGQPQQQFPSIHIAGTNGKGTTAHTLASILQEAHYRVGLYTSPHLVDFRERIRVNGRKIPARYVAHFVTSHQELIQRLHPSFFELTTALAFDYFASEHIDIAVIETGLGGRLDATNILHPLLSVITNADFDHTDLLGTTLPQIAREKAGIIKPYTPVVIGEDTPETRPVFQRRARQLHAPITFASDHSSSPNENTILTAFTVLQSLRNEQLSRINAPTFQGVVDGFRHIRRNTHLAGRWQPIDTQPPTYIDTGHNPPAFQYNRPRLQRAHRRHPHLHIILGFVADKDVGTILHLLADTLPPSSVTYYLTQPSTPRALPVSRLADLAQDVLTDIRMFDNVGEAYQAARTAAAPDHFILVTGSNYLVGDLLRQRKQSSAKKQ